MKWRSPYRCRTCGGMHYKVYGRRTRRCVVCWPLYMKDYARRHKDEYNAARMERYYRKKEQHRINVQGMMTAFPMEGRVPEIDKRHRMKREKALKEGTVTKEELLAIVERDGGRCIFCGAEVNTRCTPSKPRGFDHLFPLLGNVGVHAAWNMAVCCLDCNSDKRQRTFLEYIEDEEIPFSNFPQIPNVHFGLDDVIVLEDDDFWEDETDNIWIDEEGEVCLDENS